MSHPVKWFTSEMTGAVAPATTAGTLVSILDACLVNGFNTQSLASLTYDSVAGTCAGTVSAGHGFTRYQMILIEGAVEAGFNGEQRITAMDTTTFTFTPTGTPASATATGTITAKAAPIGSWSKAFSAANKAVYLSSDVDTSGYYLRIDDSLGLVGADVQAYESMTAVDTGTNQVGGGYWRKSDSSRSLSEWAIVGDSRGFYLYLSGSSTNRCVFFAGDFNSFVTMDGYAFALTHDTSNDWGVEMNFNGGIGKYDDTNGKYMGRAYDQINLNPLFMTEGIARAGLNPDGIVTGIVAGTNVPLFETLISSWRGTLPGCQCFLSQSHLQVIDTLPASLLLTIKGKNYLAFDLTGPWRT